jgi:TonB family protein
VAALAWVGAFRDLDPAAEPIEVTLLPGAGPEPSVEPAAPRPLPAPVAPLAAPRERPRPIAPQRAIAKPRPTPTAQAPAPVTEPEAAVSGSQPNAPMAALPPPSPIPSDAGRVYGEGEVDRPAAPAGAIQPRYPAREKMMGIEGTVAVLVTVDASGQVRDTEVRQSGGGGFDAAALKAIESKRFHPAQRAGRAVDSTVTVRIRYVLE